MLKKYQNNNLINFNLKMNKGNPYIICQYSDNHNVNPELFVFGKQLSFFLYVEFSQNTESGDNNKQKNRNTGQPLFYIPR